MRVERITDLVARLHAHPRRHLTLLVGVDGGGHPARSALVAALAAADPGLEVVRTKDFALPPAALPASPRGAEGGRWGVDWRRLRSQVLLPLARDRPGRYQLPDSVGELAESREVPVGGIVVVEGFYACLKQLAALYDFRIWVEPPAGPGAELAFGPDHDRAAGAHLRVDGSGAVEHDPWREYVRLRG